MFEESDSLVERAADSTIVYLARHAETVWNVERRFQGHRDSPLSERGDEQARRLAERLSREPLAAVYSSDLGRSRRTAELVAQVHKLEVRLRAGLREIDTGAWTGRAGAEVRAVPEWAPMVDLYSRRPAELTMPSGESIRDVQERALEVLREIAAGHAGQKVALITHHVVVETILAHALGLALEELWLPRRGGNCYLSVLELRDGACSPLVIYDGDHIRDLGGIDGTRHELKGTA